MIIYFVEIESPDRAYFRDAFPGHDVRFAADLCDVGEDAEIVSIFINTPVDAGFLETHRSLRHLNTRSGLTEHIDCKACEARGVTISIVPEYGDLTVAEHTLALILALSRRLREVMALSQQSRPAPFSYEAARGIELAGKTLGIVGMGRIAQHVLKLARAFQLNVIAWDPLAMPPERAAALGFRWCSLEELLAESHIVTLHVRLTPQTRHLLNRERLAQCRPGVFVINTARGGLIETEALSEALESGQVGGAGLDVLEEESVLRESPSQVISAQIVENLHSGVSTEEVREESRLRTLQHIMKSSALLSRPNVVFTPHVAFNSVEAIERLHRATVANLHAFLRGEELNLVTT